MSNTFFYRSIFNNAVVNGNFSYIHMSLIYKTRMHITAQMYADALIEFLENIDLKNVVYNKILSNTVVELLASDIKKIHTVALQKFQDYTFLQKTIKSLEKIYLELPQNMQEFEQYMKNNKEIPRDLFKKIYRMLIQLIAFNYFNFVIEAYLPALLTQTDTTVYSDYLYKNAFSHIMYFNEEKNKIEKEIDLELIKTFCWNVGFLENEVCEPTVYEDVNYIAEFTDTAIKKEDLIPTEFSYPRISCFELNPQMPILVSWAKLLQINLEIRHYWSFRLYRNLRYCLNQDYDKLSNWVLKDYEKKFFKIK